MLGFVNGRSCAHKSKPRGLILNNNSELPFWKFAAKLLQFFEICLVVRVEFRVGFSNYPHTIHVH